MSIFCPVYLIKSFCSPFLFPLVLQSIQVFLILNPVPFNIRNSLGKHVH